jgi:signal transduction histidine kinase
MSGEAVAIVGRTRNPAVLMVSAAGILISILLFVVIAATKDRIAAFDFRTRAEDEHRALQADLKSASDLLYTLRAFYEADAQPPSRTEFQTFARDLRSRLPGLRNTGWAPVVAEGERESFERKARNDGAADYRIWERDAQGQRIPALSRPEHVAILYPDPPQIAAQVRGFDIASEAQRSDAMRRARLADAPAATPPLNLITRQQPDGFMTFLPVYRKPGADVNANAQEGAAVVEGYMYAVFATAPMIENVLSAKTRPHGTSIYFFDPGKPEGQRLIHWHPSRVLAAPTEPPDEAILLAGMHWQTTLEVADQAWGAIYVPATPLPAGYRSWQALLALAGGLVLTGMVVGYLLHLESLNARLRATSAAAEAANRVKSTFLANTSHELRTPLNAIIGFSEFMIAEPFGAVGSERYLGYLDDILHSGRHLLRIINDILDLSKIEAGRAEIGWEQRVEVAHALGHACRMLEPQAKKTGVLLMPSSVPQGLAVRGNERLLCQAILNIVSNAVKFTPAGGNVAVAADIGANGSVAITVSDTGIGMSEAEIAVAFEPFGRVDNKLARRQEGTGLGMPLARAMIELHQGTLSVASTPGVGTRVTIEFPRARRCLQDADERADDILNDATPRRAAAEAGAVGGFSRPTPRPG